MNEETIDIGNYTEERIRLEAERSNESMNDWIVSFFEARCNAPGFSDQEVQCTNPSPRSRKD